MTIVFKIASTFYSRFFTFIRVPLQTSNDFYIYTANYQTITTQFSDNIKNMKDSKRSNSQTNRNLVFTVTTPTQELKAGQYIEELIQVHTTYQVIPSPLILNYDAENVVLSALPYTKNKLLDITLPFIVVDQAANETFYLGRYLLHNQRLVGIRLSSAKKEENYPNSDFKKWRSGKNIKYRVPKAILDYYKNSRFPEGSFSPEIVVGDFVLSMNDVKICALFESQIEDNQQTLIEYKRQGCEIFSIVCDIPRDQAFESTFSVNSARLATKNENIFKRFIRQHNRLMLYAGVRMATNKGLFLSNSFILHPELPEKNIEPFYFNDGISLSVLCNTQIMKRDEITHSKREKFTETKAKPELYVNSNFISIKITSPGKSIKCYANGQNDISSFTKDHGDLLKKMRLWYIYHSDNKKRPFIMGLPLSDAMNEAVSQFAKMSQFLNIPIQSFLIFYKKNSKYITSESEEDLGVEIYGDLEDLCKKCKQQKFYIYTDDNHHYKDLNEKAQKNNKITIFLNYINFNETNEVKISADRTTKLIDFANYIVRNRIIGYQKILKQARNPAWKLNRDEQIEIVTIYLKNKVRSEVNNHPFYKNILDKSSDEIRMALIDAESKMVNDQGSSILTESNLNLSQVDAMADDEVKSVESQEKEFWGKYKDMKKFQSRQLKKTHIKCHKCNLIFEKTLFYKCNSCRTQICYLCITETFQKEPKSKKQFFDMLKCLVCRKICSCVACKLKSKPEQSVFNPIPVNILDISHLSHTQQEKQEKEANEYRQSCTVCLINGRKGNRIKVSCATCDRQQCLLCIRSQNRKNTTFSTLWQCSVCKPEQKPALKDTMIDEQEEKKENQAMQVQPRVREASASNSDRGAPQRKQWNQNNNNNNRGNNFRPQNNSRDSNFNKNKMVDENEERKSASRSGSPPRNKKPAQNKNRSPSCSNSPPKKQPANNANKNQPEKKRSASRSASPPRRQPVNSNRNQNPPERKKSASRSATPPRRQPVNNNNNRNQNPPQRKRSASRSATPPKKPVMNNNNRNQNPPERKRSPSKSGTPPRKANNNNNKQKDNKRSASRSGSPPKNNAKTARKKSASRSNSPVKQPPTKSNNNNNKKRSASRSHTPPKAAKIQDKKRKSASRSASPPKKKKASASKSGSGSRSRSRDRNNNNNNNQKKQPQKLWGDKAKNNWNNNNRDGNQGGYNNNRDNNRDGNQGYNNRGGFNNRGGGYDRNQGGDRGNFRGRGGGRGGYNNNFNRDRDGNNNNNNYNRDRNNNNNRNNNNDNDGENNNTSQIISMPTVNYESNNDMDY